MKSPIRLAVIAVACVVGPAWAQDPPPLSAYGALPAVEQVALSPSGDRLALIATPEGQRAALFTELATENLVGAVRVGDAKVRGVDWISDDSVLITTSTTQAMPLIGMSLSELFVGQIYDIPSRELSQVFNGNRDLLPVLAGSPIIRRSDAGATMFVRGHSMETYRASLYRVDPRTGRGRVAVDLTENAETLVLDPAGAPLARVDYDGHRRWSLQLTRDGRFYREAWAIDAPLDQPSLVGLGRTARTVLVAAERPDVPGDDADDGRDLFEVDVDTGAWTRVQVGGDNAFILRHPATGLMIGHGDADQEGVATYSFDDPVNQRAWASISRPFAGQNPSLVSWSDDFRQAVVYTAGSQDSGAYHLIDLDTRQAKVVGESYPSILPEHVGPVRSIHYAAQDGLEIHGYLTLPPGATEPKGLPLVVLAHGGPASQDTGGFDWWAQALASRGYAVLQANFRGSTGYGEAFMEAGYGEWGRKMQTDLSDGVRHLVGEGVVDPARVCIVGASYGGYAALAGVTLDAGVYRCAVSVAGVSDLRRMVLWAADRGARRDNDAVRYWNRFMGADRLGDRDLNAISPAHLVDRVDAPVLLLHGRDDTVVPIEQSRIMATALRRAGKPHQMIELTGEDHWLSRAETRQKMLEETVAFLTTHNPAD